MGPSAPDSPVGLTVARDGCDGGLGAGELAGWIGGLLVSLGVVVTVGAGGGTSRETDRAIVVEENAG